MWCTESTLLNYWGYNLIDYILIITLGSPMGSINCTVCLYEMNSLFQKGRGLLSTTKNVTYYLLTRLMPHLHISPQTLAQDQATKDHQWIYIRWWRYICCRKNSNIKMNEWAITGALWLLNTQVLICSKFCSKQYESDRNIIAMRTFQSKKNEEENTRASLLTCQWTIPAQGREECR